MRLRRLVEVKPSGKTYVDQTVRDDYNSVQRREWLEMALVDSIRKHGTDRKNFKKVLAEFVTRVVVVREKMPWKYDNSIMEYFVEDECKSLLKRSEMLKETETTEKEVRDLHKVVFLYMKCLHVCSIQHITNDPWLLDLYQCAQNETCQGQGIQQGP
ncbi:Uncharacterized protein SCF082_LOCUS51918 [Durusdinium trenchii]|uniref:Uncharacterized protein n=1 Tax=Durusdinium trenchii TaxID=1381693 RepID=A0ABP0SHT9_9DINO